MACACLFKAGLGLPTQPVCPEEQELGRPGVSQGRIRDSNLLKNPGGGAHRSQSRAGRTRPRTALPFPRPHPQEERELGAQTRQPDSESWACGT